MLRHLLQIVQACHAIEASIAAIGFFAIWYRTRFWLPRYVHLLAAAGTLTGVALIFLIPAGAPAKKLGLWGSLFLVLICPALVYFFFVFYGGQAAAHERRQSTPKR